MPGVRCGIERASALMTLAVGAMMTAVLVLAAQTRSADPECTRAPVPAQQARAC
jgi:hypothetical protein